MIIIERFEPDPYFKNTEICLQTETFETWGDAFLYLERKVGPLDHETRKRAQRFGFFESGPQLAPVNMRMDGRLTSTLVYRASAAD